MAGDGDGGSSGTRAGRRRGLIEAKLDCVANPLKRDIYWALRARPLSAAEVAADLGTDVEKVRQRIRAMRKAEVVEAVGWTRRRGVAEGLFQVCDREMMISEGELETADRSMVERSHLAFIARMWKEASRPPAFEGVDPTPGSGHLSKVDLLLDDQGWSDAHSLLTDTAAAVKAARDRLPRRDDPQSREPSLFLVLFESIFPDPRVGPGPPCPPPEGLACEGDRGPEARLLGSRQLEIVRTLAFRPSTTSELADRLRLPIYKIKNDLRVLRSRGLVIVGESRLRRNTVEHVYTLDLGRYETILEDQRRASPRQLRAYRDALARSACGDLVEALRDGALERRSDYVLMRIPMGESDESTDPSARILRGAFTSTLEIGEASRSRLRAAGGTPIAAHSSMLLMR